MRTLTTDFHRSTSALAKAAGLSETATIDELADAWLSFGAEDPEYPTSAASTHEVPFGLSGDLARLEAQAWN